MPSVFVYSAGKAAAAHFARTIESGIPLSTFRSFLPAGFYHTLEEAYPDGTCYLWGDRGGEHGRMYWEQISAGDLALCYREKSIVAASTVVATIENEEAGIAAWPDAASEPYRLLFFLSKPVRTNAAVESLPKYFGKVYQGLRRLPEPKIQEILSDFGTLDRFVTEALISAPSGPRLKTLPTEIPRETVLDAASRFDAGAEHGFADSTGYDVVIEGRRYPPKAIVGLAAESIEGTKYGPEDFSGGLGSKCFRLLQQAGFEIMDKASSGAWLFQGNPSRYDIDDYLSRYSFIYWSVPRFQKQIQIGDRCVLWRAGDAAGAVAVGHIEELPTPRNAVRDPECLGDDLWHEEPDSPESMKVGIAIDEVRLDAEAGFIPRQAFINSLVLQSSTIIRAPTGTVFRLNEAEATEFLTLWRSATDLTVEVEYEALEGTRRLRKHYARERCRALVSRKREQFASHNAGRVFCELCGFDFAECYPRQLGEGFIEVHHLAPLADNEEPRRTTLADLMLVCSNCHRMIHRTKDVDGNMRALQGHFGH